MEIGRPSVENVTFGLRPRVTFSTSGSSYFHIPLTTVRHLLNVTTTLHIDWLPINMKLGNSSKTRTVSAQLLLSTWPFTRVCALWTSLSC